VEKELKYKDNDFSKNHLKMQKIEVTMQEIWQQTKHKVHRSKKTYTRKNKHKNND
jgi:hypothetical protein